MIGDFYTVTDPETGTRVVVAPDRLAGFPVYSVNMGPTAPVPAEFAGMHPYLVAMELLLRAVKAIPFDPAIRPEEWVPAV